MAEPLLDALMWPKTPRLNRGMLVTEKIDGTNCAVIIKPLPEDLLDVVAMAEYGQIVDLGERGVEESYVVTAQNRERLLQPGPADSFDFAKWVWRHAEDLALALGPGYHYGEWWGGGIQRKYGLNKADKRFALFDVKRYSEIDFASYDLPNVATVPVLGTGPFDTTTVNIHVALLREGGSVAVPGYMKPEGVIVLHEASGQYFKVTCERDEEPKSLHPPKRGRKKKVPA